MSSALDRLDPRVRREIISAANEGREFSVTLTGLDDPIEIPAYLVECTVTRRIGYYRDLCWFGQKNPQIRTAPAAKLVAALEAEGKTFQFGSSDDGVYLRAEVLEAACQKILRRLSSNVQPIELSANEN